MCDSINTFVIGITIYTMKFHLGLVIKHMNRFPTDEEYEEFVKKLYPHQWKLRLTNGNCGIFAYALKEVFETGELFSISDFTHVLLKYEERFYDGVTIYHSYDELKNSRWGRYMNEDEDEILDDDDAFPRIKNHTSNDREVEDFVQLITAGLIDQNLEDVLDEVIDHDRINNW